jgi:hypothetical protein
MVEDEEPVVLAQVLLQAAEAFMGLQQAWEAQQHL